MCKTCCVNMFSACFGETCPSSLELTAEQTALSTLPSLAAITILVACGLTALRATTSMIRQTMWLKDIGSRSTKCIKKLLIQLTWFICRLTAGLGCWRPYSYQATHQWGTAMCQLWSSWSSMYSVPCTVYSSLESRSHGSQNIVQCLWSSLDETQQA